MTGFADRLGVLDFSGHTDTPNTALATALAGGLRLVRVVPPRRQGLKHAAKMIDPILAGGAEALICLTDVDLSAVDNHLAWCRDVATAYAGRGVSYEIWNEPTKATGAPADFAMMVNQAAFIIRDADPAAKVVGCAFHGADLLRAGSWSRQVIEAGEFPITQLDAISFHLIRGLQPHQQTLDDAAAVRAYLPTRPALFLTEVGYSSNPRWQEPAYQGETGQAQWITDTLPPLLGIAERAYWALLTDGLNDAGPNQPFYFNGIFRTFEEGWVPKPAWSAFQSLLASSPAPTAAPPRKHRRRRRAG